MQQPTIGRMVHFHAPTDEGGELYAAIITRVGGEGNAPTTVDLVTFGPGSMYFHFGVPFSDEPGERRASCWSWPPRVG